jgi:hypothetical protein
MEFLVGTEGRRCLDIISRGWDDALGRLKAHIERT